MATYGVSVIRADESYGSATIYYDEAPTVYVEITAINSSNSKWRIRGRASLGDSRVYLDGQGIGTFTFESDDNYSYIFQIQNWNCDWVNTTNAYGEEEENSIFDVVFESDGEDSGDDSGSGGGSSGDWYGDAHCNVSSSMGSLSAVVNWDSGPEVTVEVICNAHWKLINSNSGEEIFSSSYNFENNPYIATFNANDGEVYTFQIDAPSWEGDWSSSPYGSFTVDFYNGDSGSGGNSGGGNSSNDSLKEYTFTALGVTAKATYTSGPDVTITILSWDEGVYGSSTPYWRIKGVYTEGDKYNTYLGQNNKKTNSFNSIDLGYGDGYDEGGKNYIFQVCKNGNWNNDGGSASKFNVDFSIDSGGASGGGSDSVTPCGYLIVNQGEGTKLHVQRIWPPERTCYKDLETSEPIYIDGEDTFFVFVEVLDGYELDYYIVDGVKLGYQLDNFVEFEPNGRPPEDTNTYYQVAIYGNVTVTSTATPIATANIYSNSEWNRYYLNIYSNSEWNRYAPYIYKNSQWERYR